VDIESLYQWFGNLKKAAGISKRPEDVMARNKSKEAVKTPEIKGLTITEGIEQFR
jgi:hypothetical protein